jgi:hypothetical protein
MRDGEWYCNNAAGNQIAITSGTGLSVAAAAGIGGDYGGANPAAVTFDDANGRYDCTTDPGVYAAWRAGSFHFMSATSAQVCTIKAPDTLAAAWTITLPTAAPASTSLMMMGSTGVVSTSRTPTIDTLTAGTVTSTGAVTTGESTIRHAAQTIWLSPMAVKLNPSGPASATNVNHIRLLDAGSGSQLWYFTPQIPIGARLTGVSAKVLDTTTKLTLTVYMASGGTTATTLGTAQSSGGSSVNTISITGLTETMASGEFITMSVQTAATDYATQELRGVSYTFDRL